MTDPVNPSVSQGGYEAFLAHAREVAVRFEQRRTLFLRQLKFRCVVAAVLLLLFPLWFSLLENADARHNVISSLSWVLIHIIAGAVIILMIAAWAVMPLFRYRHYTVQIGRSIPGVSGISQQLVSLKGEIFKQLFSYFGDFTFYSDRSLSLRSLRNAPELPEFDEFSGEDYIRGTMQGVSVEMMETELCVRRQSENRVLFRGLLIVLDINNTNLVLHGKFAGRTVVIARKKDEDGAAAAEKDLTFHAVPLPDVSQSEHFIAYTTDDAEAVRLLNPDLQRTLLALSDAVREARHQVRHADDRVAFAISSVTHGLSDILALTAEKTLNWFTTGRARLQPKRRSLRQRQTAISPGAESFNASVHCSFYDDKVLISIPSTNNLFEPDIIFRTPLHEDDIKLAYKLMTLVGEVADAVVESLPKEMV